MIARKAAGFALASALALALGCAARAQAPESGPTPGIVDLTPPAPLPGRRAEAGSAEPGISVSGSGEVSVDAEGATIALAVVTTQATLPDLLREHAARVARARAAIEAAGTRARLAVAAGSVEITRPGGDYSASSIVSGRGRTDAFRAETVFEIAVESFERLEGVMAELVAANVADGLSARPEPRAPEAALARARRAAFAQAREAAAAYADAAGLRLGSARRVSERSASRPVSLEVRTSPRSRPGPTLVPSRTVVFSAQVDVTFGGD